MASVFRFGYAKILSVLPSNATVHSIRIRCISSKTSKLHRIEREKPAPWDYINKRATFLRMLFDGTSKRFDENTKVIVVEGPPASGKTELAKHLAEELEMVYYPEANLDMEYINYYGYDLRQLDPQVPESCRSFDVNNFLANPRHRLSASFQIRQYCIKYSQYIDVLAHLLNTGKGVVLDRCVYSDFVFAEAMRRVGYISKKAHSAYFDVRRFSIDELMRPHLVIYLDVPVPKVMKNIQERALPYECNSPALTAEYLQAIEDVYKREYLATISQDAALLIYDWSHGGDSEIVVEDIEQVDFSEYGKHDTQFRDWDLWKEDDWTLKRWMCTEKKFHMMCHLNVPRYDVPELITEAEDKIEYDLVMEEAPGGKFYPGFDSSLGDRNFLLWREKRLTLAKRERRTDFSGLTI